MNIRIASYAMHVKTELQPQRNIYKVYCDGELWCWTENDDDGLKLEIAVAKLELIKEGTQ